MVHAPPVAEFYGLLARGGGSNVAVTADDESDSRLRPRFLPENPAASRARLLRAIASLPRWRVIDSTGEVLWATRRTRLFRFLDDVLVLAERRGAGTVIAARSASRVGRSDLGQNRRNLAELWRALDQVP